MGSEKRRLHGGTRAEEEGKLQPVLPSAAEWSYSVIARRANYRAALRERRNVSQRRHYGAAKAKVELKV